ncbi:unnamed protein product [Amoebophrya sp. A25]|nr:unnamed protein product [Amoebophrya sp. A25]|eukprot:GSA25T00016956001.1
MILYDEDWFFPLLFKTEGSVGLRSCWYAFPSAIFGVLLLIAEDNIKDFRTDYLGIDDDQVGSTQIWAATTSTLALLMSFRTSRGIARFWEGTGLMHQMRGEWFDTVSNCVSFSIQAKRQDPDGKSHKVQKFRHTLIRLMSLVHGYALQEVSGDLIDVETIDKKGLHPKTIAYLDDLSSLYKFNKVELCLHLIQTLIISAYHEGVLVVPPPILSRVFQTISRGFVHLLNTKKITDTKFPFPYVQLIIVSLCIYSVFTPLVLTSVLKNKVIVFILSFFPLWVLSGLNHVSIELENPFGDDDNDLPLGHFQDEMDRTLLLLIHPRSDLRADVVDGAVNDVDDLMQKFGLVIYKEEIEYEDGHKEFELSFEQREKRQSIKPREGLDRFRKYKSKTRKIREKDALELCEFEPHDMGEDDNQQQVHFVDSDGGGYRKNRWKKFATGAKMVRRMALGGTANNSRTAPLSPDERHGGLQGGTTGDDGQLASHGESPGSHMSGGGAVADHGGTCTPRGPRATRYRETTSEMLLDNDESRTNRGQGHSPRSGRAENGTRSVTVVSLTRTGSGTVQWSPRPREDVVATKARPRVPGSRPSPPSSGRTSPRPSSGRTSSKSVPDTRRGRTSGSSGSGGQTRIRRSMSSLEPALVEAAVLRAAAIEANQPVLHEGSPSLGDATAITKNIHQLEDGC